MKEGLPERDQMKREPVGKETLKSKRLKLVCANEVIEGFETSYIQKFEESDHNKEQHHPKNVLFFLEEPVE